MHARENSSDRLVVELTRDEAVIIFGCIVEAAEALSDSEFRARVGRAEADALALAAQLKQCLDA